MPKTTIVPVRFEECDWCAKEDGMMHVRVTGVQIGGKLVTLVSGADELEPDLRCSGCLNRLAEDFERIAPGTKITFVYEEDDG